jgi:tetratricopeptide (TPR) repeat protein
MSNFDYPPQSQPPSLPPRRRSWLWVVLVVGAVGAVGLVAANLHRALSVRQILPRHQRPPSATQRLLIEADEVTVTETLDEADPDYVAIEALLEKVGRAATLDDIKPLVDAADMRAMVAFKGSDERCHELVMAGIQESVALLDWQALRITRMAVSPSRQRASVTIDVPQANAMTSQRLWLVRRDGQWRLYDECSVDTGIRTTTLTRWFNETFASADQRDEWLADWRRSVQALTDGELEVARQCIARLRRPQLPGQVERAVRMQEAVITMSEGRYADAIDLLESCYHDGAHLLRAKAYMLLSNWDQALHHSELYRQAAGPGARADGVAGWTLLNMGRESEARQMFARGLAANPRSLDCLAGLAVTISEADLENLAPKIAAQPELSASIFGISGNLHAWGRQHRLVDLSLAILKLHPDHYAPLYTLGLGLEAQQKWVLAADAMRRSLACAPLADVEAIQAEMISCYCQVGQALEAYQQARSKRAAMRQITDLIDGGDLDALGEIIDRHEKADPDDPLLPYSRAQLLMANDDWAGAAKLLEAARVAPQSNEQRLVVQQDWVYAMYRLGRATDALVRAYDTEDAFRQLAELCLQDDQSPMLENLAAAHARQQPRSPHLHIALARMHWQAQQYERAMECLDRAPRQAVLKDPNLRLWYEDIRVRGNIRLGHFDEAIKAAKASTAIDQNPYYEIVVEICRFEPGAALALTETWVKQGGQVEWLYQDEDAAAALLRPQMAPWVAKYPYPVNAAPSQPAGQEF